MPDRAILFDGSSPFRPGDGVPLRKVVAFAISATPKILRRWAQPGGARDWNDGGPWTMCSMGQVAAGWHDPDDVEAGGPYRGDGGWL
jgi:hypothetical protein